ncbi:MAG: VOC family protein [Thermomicrobiales bacterium]
MDWKLEVVIVPVSDVDRAKRFYHEQVGFPIDHDTGAGGPMRIVQLTPPGSGCSIVLGTGIATMTPGTLQGVQLVVADLDAARQQLIDGGVEVSPIRHLVHGIWQDGRGEPWNAFIFFSDPDGNGWTVQERPAGS